MIDIETFATTEDIYNSYIERLYMVGDFSIGIISDIDFISDLFQEVIKLEEVRVQYTDFGIDFKKHKTPYILYVNGVGELFVMPFMENDTLAECDEWFIDMDGSVSQDIIDEASNYGCNVLLFGREDPIYESSNCVVENDSSKTEDDSVIDQDFFTHTFSKLSNGHYISLAVSSDYELNDDEVGKVRNLLNEL